MRAALLAFLVALLAGPAFAAPASSYPVVAATGADKLLGTQQASGTTSNFTALSVAQTLQSATGPWTTTQTFPAGTAITGSIVLTPGDIPGFPPTRPTPPNGSMWTTFTNPALWVELGGLPTDISPEGISVKNYGANGNAVEHYYCIIATSSNILGCTAGTFTAAEIGNAISVNGAGAAGGELITTISTISLASFTGTLSGTALSVSAVTGSLSAGMAIAGAGVSQGTYIVSGGGTSWVVNNSQTVGPVAMTGNLETLGANASTSTTGLYWQGALDGLDNTTPIQNAVAALTPGQCLIFPKGLYFVQGTISLSGKQGLCLRGKGYNRQFSDGNTPQLVYVGATGSLISIPGGSLAIKIEDLGLSYFGADYAGAGANLVSVGTHLSPASVISFRDDRIGGLSFVLQQAAGASGTGQAGGANSLVKLLGVYGVMFDGDVFMNAQTAILGPLTLAADANVVTIENSTFSQGFAKAPIQWAGQAWSILHDIFEPYDNVVSSTKHCGGIQAAATSDTVSIEGGAVIGVQFGDASVNSGNCIDLSTNGSSATVSGVVITGSQFFTAAKGVVYGNGSGNVTSGNTFRAVHTAQDTSASGVSVASSDLCNNAYFGVTTEAVSSGLASGCYDSLDGSSNAIKINVGGVSSTYARFPTTTVSGLATIDPSPVAGDRATVSDATACTFGSTLTGSSTTKCPVYYDGAAWRGG